MKKNPYIKPECESIEVEITETIMTGSDPSMDFSGEGTEGSGISQSGRERNFWN